MDPVAYDWLNNFYMADVAVLLIGVALELKCVTETNLILALYKPLTLL